MVAVGGPTRTWSPSRLRLGVAVTGAHPPGEAARAYTDLLRVAGAAEAAGLDSVWLGDHVGYEGQPWLGNLAVLAGAARVTGRIGLGAIMIGALRPPAVLADDLATVDAAAGGRLSVCVVAGWRRQDFRAVGVPYPQRTARAVETVRAVRSIWAGESFQGAHLAVPVQGPGLAPVHEVEWWFGGSGPGAAAAAAALGAGFLQSAHVDDAQVRRLSQTYTAAWTDRRRGPARGIIRQTHVAGTEAAARTAAGPVLDAYYRTYRGAGLGRAEGLGTADDAARFMVGTPDTVAARLAAAARVAGAELVVCRVGWPGMSVDEVVRGVHLLGTAVLPALRAGAPAGGPDGTRDGAPAGERGDGPEGAAA
jgi:alkanesulfonate monooxygenase SsuD/methylene tetrahydromethanopterin reductase-like flavin-dependent oxidoreductase (luciferase family)